MTKNELRKFNYANHRNAWKFYYPEGNGRAKKGYVLHHKDPSLKHRDPIRYAEWRPEDLQMMTNAEHSRLHYTEEKCQKMIDASMPKHLGTKHWFKGDESILAKESPGPGWQLGIGYNLNLQDLEWDGTTTFVRRKNLDYKTLCGENNSMFKKSSYENKSTEELEQIKLKKQNTFASHTEDEKKLINSRRGGGSPVLCITTGEVFKSACSASKVYKGCSKLWKVYQHDIIRCGYKDNIMLDWRLATEEEYAPFVNQWKHRKRPSKEN